ncbi:tetratricopeptide repeat protein [Streptococcus sciuri]|uniref:Tetratricopeptide repeat protein n=1 Tax=Streptococcus sciuri TaxID=2973939 RepID=A0ABT2F7C2_9STRE|nr:hypothetical protein [Streptococcus sciuri]MCS4487740.1 hypothetical protein [Streptococcus sciuri]
MQNSEKMIVALDNQDLTRADKYFERALREDDDEMLLDLGAYLENIGFLPQAKRIYLKLRKDFPEVNINLAQIAAEDDDITEAFLYLDAIDETSPEYVSALLVMADLYDMEGLIDVAREKLLLAATISPEPIVLFGLAELDSDLGYFKEAIDYYAQLDNREILEMTGVSTYQRIGHAYAALGKLEAAIEFLEKAIAIEYDDQTVFELAVILYEMGEYQKANLYFKQLETMNPDFDNYEYIYALSLQKENQGRKALTLVQQGLSKNSFDSNLLLLASQLSYEQHDRDSAERYLLEARRVSDDTEEILMRLSNLYLEENRYEDVVMLDKETTDNILTKWNIAKAYRKLENEEKAYEVYQALETDLYDNPEFLEDYAYLLYEYGYREHAKSIIEHYLKLVPDDITMADLLENLRLD